MSRASLRLQGLPPNGINSSGTLKETKTQTKRQGGGITKSLKTIRKKGDLVCQN